MKFRIEVSDHEEVPPFYGIAYHDHLYRRSVCFPLFINLIVILYRDFVRWMKWPKAMP
jgi:hypothetical protein